MTEALTYSTNQRTGLKIFLEDGRLPLSHNLCEANIKPYATARRAWLFADTPGGAKANAILYTLTESARANKLDVYEYLKYLLAEMPNNAHLEHPEVWAFVICFSLWIFNVFLYFYHVCSDDRIDIFRCLLLYSRLLCKCCKVTDSSTNRTYDILTTSFLYFHLTACFQ